MVTTQYYTATSLDGYLADENHSLDWLFEVGRADAGENSFAAFFADVGAMAMGATTYEWEETVMLEHRRGQRRGRSGLRARASRARC